MITIDQINFQRTWLGKNESGLSELQIDDLIRKTKRIVEIVKKQKYPFIDFIMIIYLQIILAVEAPLNQDISKENLFLYFGKINLGQSITKLTNWNRTCCSLIRLFCMENFKYSGHWHRDREDINQLIQVSFYLKDESGFKIRKKFLETKKDNKYPNNLCLDVNNKLLPMKLNRDEYDIIDAKKVISFLSPHYFIKVNMIVQDYNFICDFIIQIHKN